MDNRLPKLTLFKETLHTLNLSDHYQNDAVVEYLGYAIKQISSVIKEAGSPAKIETRLLENFGELEDVGWYLNDSALILNAWYQLGEIVGLTKLEAKLNQFRKTNQRGTKVNKLLYLKANLKINNEMLSAPKFYKEMRQLMAETIEQVLIQFKKNSNIDEMLTVFEVALNKFDRLETDDYSFGDTVDRETVGDFLTAIREILEFNSTRGLLRDKLE